jgi:arylsulfatase A-like enzyme/HEAT repeat protein
MVSRSLVRYLRYILGGALGGLGSGLLASLLELSSLPSSDLSLGLALALAGIIVTAFGAVGLALGLLYSALRLAAAGVARVVTRGGDHSRAERVAFGAIGGLLSMPALFLLLNELSTGRKASHVLGPVVVRALLVLLGAGIVGVVAWSGLALAQRLDASRRVFPLAAAAILLGATLGLFFADAHLYQRLYESLHLVLLLAYAVTGVLTTVALGAGARSAARPEAVEARPSHGRRWSLVLVVSTALVALAGIGGWRGRRALEQDQHMRYCALELSVVTDKLLRLMPLEVRSESPLFLNALGPRGTASKGTYTVPDANVLIVSIDALRPDHLGAYGYGRPTSPNIDALAARSVRFEHAYCPVPLTCYSVPSMHTGDYLRSTLPLVDKRPPTLARILAGRGYTTAAFYNSSMFFCDDKLATAYGEVRFDFAYTETTHRPAGELADQILSYLHEFRRSGKRKLLLWAHFFDVHEPYEERPEYAFGKTTLDRYDSEIAYVDAAIGRLVAAVSELQGPTIFILTSDHGEEFKEHGGYYHGSSLYEEQIRVPLLIGVPGLKPQVIPTPAQLVDIVPTTLALLGQRIPESARGRSLVPELLGKIDRGRAAFSEVHTKKMVRYGDWKLIHDFRSGTYELYDLRSDPRERLNLIARRPGEASRLKGLLNGWFDQIRAVARAKGEARPEAIDLGRIGDRRSLPLLAQLVLDGHAESRWRQEAARLIGQLQEGSVAEELWQAVADDDEQVAAEAAVALGEIKDRRARLVLPMALTSTDVELRMRAGIALARVDSPASTPALIEALYSDNWEVQNRAAHYLGFVGDKRAVGPLLRAAQQLHLRPRVALTLGRLGARLKPDKRIVTWLLDAVRGDAHAEVRQRALLALGYLGDRRPFVVRALARLLVDEPELVWVPESLSRLGGLGSYWAPGLDLTPARRGLKEGWGPCTSDLSLASDEFQESTWCATIAPVATVHLSQPRKPHATTLVMRLRALNPDLKNAPLTVTVNGHRLPATRLEGGWQVVRLSTEARHWRQGRNLVRLQLTLPKGPTPPAGLLAVDYFLVVPPANGGKS